jgi:DNA-binding CsgD family transcriptional regulator
LIGKQVEGIAARRSAADLWRELNNPLKQGENLAYLMSMLTRIGQKAEAAQAIEASIKILEALSPGPELAMAYRVQAHQCLVSRDLAEALTWAQKSLKLAEQFNDAEVLAAVYITIGTARLFFDYESACAYLEDKIAFAQDAGLEVRVAHIYSNLGSGSGELFHFDRAEQYLTKGIAYAAERDLDSHRLYMLAWQALLQVRRGYWSDAVQTATAVLHSMGATVIARITALVALGLIRVRRGEPGVAEALDKALELATATGTIQRLGPVRAARAEAAWLAGDTALALQEVQAVFDLAASKQHPWIGGELAFWRWQAGEEVTSYTWLAAPYALQIAGDWYAAAAAWEALGCPYEQARALAQGDEEAQKQALVLFEQLGAQPMIEQVRQALHEAGVASIPRGPRPTTQENPFQLTNRQVEVWALLTEELTNVEIAGRLHISPKTVDHHVSAVLGKLHVSSREEAAELARQHLTN